MFVATVHSRGSTWYGLAESRWDPERKQSRRHTIMSLVGLPLEAIRAMKVGLDAEREARKAAQRAGQPTPQNFSTVELGAARPHGAGSAVLRVVERLQLAEMLDPAPSPARARVLAMLIGRVLDPGSKLELARELANPDIRTVGALLGVSHCGADQLYEALDWLDARQSTVEQRLAARHLAEGAVVLYDATSSYFHGTRCRKAKRGHPRDGHPELRQVVYALLCAADGCPVAIKVFAGNTADPKTVGSLITKLTRRFGMRHVVLVGDRGMLTQARLRADLTPAGLDWVSALGSQQLRALARKGGVPPAQGRGYELAAVEHPDFPGERLVVCRNPQLRQRRRRKRRELLAEAEKTIQHRAAQYAAGTIDRDTLNRHLNAKALRRMQKHFRFEFDDDTGAFTWSRQHASIRAEAALDGLYVVRTSCPAERLGDADAVRAYKSLRYVEQGFHAIKNLLHVRPVRHYRKRRVRAHIFLCMLAYYVEWHLRRDLHPMLFHDPEPPGADADPVAPRRRSAAAQRQDSTGRDAAGRPLHSFPQVLQILDTITVIPLTLRRTPKGAPIRSQQLSMIPALAKRAFRLLRCEVHEPPPTPPPRRRRRKT